MNPNAPPHSDDDDVRPLLGDQNDFGNNGRSRNLNHEYLQVQRKPSRSPARPHSEIELNDTAQDQPLLRNPALAPSKAPRSLTPVEPKCFVAFIAGILLIFFLVGIALFAHYVFPLNSLPVFGPSRVSQPVIMPSASFSALSPPDTTGPSSLISQIEWFFSVYPAVYLSVVSGVLLVILTALLPIACCTKSSSQRCCSFDIILLSLFCELTLAIVIGLSFTLSQHYPVREWTNVVSIIVATPLLLLALFSMKWEQERADGATFVASLFVGATIVVGSWDKKVGWTWDLFTRELTFVNVAVPVFTATIVLLFVFFVITFRKSLITHDRPFLSVIFLHLLFGTSFISAFAFGDLYFRNDWELFKVHFQMLDFSDLEFNQDILPQVTSILFAVLFRLLLFVVGRWGDLFVLAFPLVLVTIVHANLTPLIFTFILAGAFGDVAVDKILFNNPLRFAALCMLLLIIIFYAIRVFTLSKRHSAYKTRLAKRRNKRLLAGAINSV
eukprot:TRINITY_DN7603_c0_g1_i1.p1 TRINITY_DN7603_c0_g1~~TRINITY_DN7603_c0_g1_i1.p1  ORF type:complete len:498 (+),score=103.32 TRINITY_DN7603_c0_g1_i1:16-1509(+)